MDLDLLDLYERASAWTAARVPGVIDKTGPALGIAFSD
jgi:hypothetical protein